jgi:polysaccharide deacetylase family protein (PEP-CTERM system associated)
MLTNALSVDVEEYYHGLEFEAAVREDQRAHLPTRVEESIDRVLALLDPLGIRATFFIVGQVAEAHPAMVKKITKVAHEIACHSYRHELVSRQNPQEFREDIRRAKTILEDLSGKAVIGYRAPNYSIGQDQLWAYDILLEEGFLYDSSIYPILHDRYGCVNAPRFPYDIRDNGVQKLIEFPIGTTRWFGANFPIGGGGYFRLLPEAWFHKGIRRVNKGEGKPVMFYFHPWELDPHQPRPPMPWRHSFRHYVGIDRLEGKLFRLLKHCRFTTVRDVLKL